MPEIDINPMKARITQLGFKKATSGLTPEEEQELAVLRQQLALTTGTNKS